MSNNDEQYLDAPPSQDSGSNAGPNTGTNASGARSGGDNPGRNIAPAGGARGGEMVPYQSSDEKTDVSVVKLGVEPYVSWKKHMMNVFKSRGLEQALTDARFNLVNAKQDSLAQAILTSTLDKTNRMNCIDCETAKEIWERLQSLHEVKTSFETQNLFVQLNNYRMGSAATVAESIAEIRYIAAKLKTLGESISDNNLMSVILRALPKSLKHIQLSWKTMSASDRNIKNLVSFIMSEAADGLEEADEVALMARQSGPKGRGFRAKTGSGQHRQRRGPQRSDQCNYCKKFGHWARDCYKKKNDDDEWNGKPDGSWGRPAKEESSDKPTKCWNLMAKVSSGQY